MFQRLQHMQQPKHRHAPRQQTAARRRFQPWSAMRRPAAWCTGGNQESSNSSETNDFWRLRKIYDHQVDLFSPLARWVTDDARDYATRGGATQFDCLANLWS